jgi:hypothetical protein
MADRESIKANLENHFRFLQNKGFQFDSFEYRQQSFGCWEITFKAKKCILQVYRERYNDINIVFKSAENPEENKWFGLGTLVYFISGGKNFIGLFEGKWIDTDGQIKRFINILNIYLDDILNLFENNFAQTSKAIEEMSKPLFELNMAEYRKREENGLD